MRDLRLSFVIMLDVSIIALIGFILLPAINLAITKSINKINGYAIIKIFDKLLSTIVASSKDMATNKYPFLIEFSNNGT